MQCYRWTGYRLKDEQKIVIDFKDLEITRGLTVIKSTTTCNSSATGMITETGSVFIKMK